MCTKNESRLRTSVTIPEMNIPLSLLFDLIEFSKDRQKKIKEEIKTLEYALGSEYIDWQRDPIDVKNDLKSAIDDARFELFHWYTLHERLNTISHDILDNLWGEGTTNQDKKPQADTEAKETESTYLDPNIIDEYKNIVF